MRRYYEWEAATLADALEFCEGYRQIRPQAVFRGQSNQEWLLRANAFRGSPTPREIQFRFSQTDQFNRWWNANVPQLPLTGDQIWQIAQHYGMATDFLDFTASPWIAAFFACDQIASDQPKHRGAAIFVIDPIDFERLADLAQLHYCPPSLKPVLSRYKDIGRPNALPGLRRMQAQRGSFIRDPNGTLDAIMDGAFSVVPLMFEEEFGAPPLFKKVSFNRRPEDHALLQTQGISLESLFPPGDSFEQQVERFMEIYRREPRITSTEIRERDRAAGTAEWKRLGRRHGTCDNCSCQIEMGRSFLVRGPVVKIGNRLLDPGDYLICEKCYEGQHWQMAGEVRANG